MFIEAVPTRLRDHVAEYIRKYELRYGHFALFVFFLLLAYALVTPPYVDMLQNWISGLGAWGYLGIFIAGFFFTYGITTPVSIVTLFEFGCCYNPLLIAFIGAFGSVCGDFVIYSLFKRKLSAEFVKVERKVDKKLHSAFLRRFGKLIAPLVIIFILGSPLPDELAAALMGSLRFEKKKFFMFSYIGNFLGILVISGFGSIL